MLSHSPTIVTDGLVLYLDAKNTRSYGGSGTTWYDLFRREHNGTLTNGVLYDNASPESFSFDGVDDFINLPINSIFNSPSVTYDCWVNLQNRNNRHIIYVNWAGNSLEVNSNKTVVMYNYSSSGQQGAVTSEQIEYNKWYNLVGVYDSNSLELKTYINGILRATRTSIPNTNYNVGVHKISGTNYGGVILGKVASIKHYNRALTQEEITQNFKALRGRFGL